jgi:hypothetical protein
LLGTRPITKDKKLTVRQIAQGFADIILYGCETYPHTLREEHRLRVSENRRSKRDSKKLPAELKAS